MVNQNLNREFNPILSKVIEMLKTFKQIQTSYIFFVLFLYLVFIAGLGGTPLASASELPLDRPSKSKKSLTVNSGLGPGARPLSASNSDSNRVLALDDYIIEVKGNHPGLKGAVISSEAGQQRSEEGQIPNSFTFYSEIKLTSDAKLTPPVFIGYDNITTNTYSFGISKITTFGLETKLHYDLLTFDYNNPVIRLSLGPTPIGGNTAGDQGNTVFPFSWANASPVLELKQSIWAGGFGRTVRATEDQTEAKALASSYEASFQAKSAIVKAEAAYWRLALARESLLVRRESLDRANKILDWNRRKFKLQLGEQSDVLQADAQVKTRELELIAAQNEERSASRDFNSLRNSDSRVVPEVIVDIRSLNLERIAIPKRAVLRDDVKAADQTMRATIAGATIAREKDTPTLDAFVSFALNGQRGYDVASNLSSAFGPSFSLNRPTRVVGLKFSIPLDIALVNKSRDAWRHEGIAAEMTYNRKLFEQEQNWKDLNESLNEAIQRFELSQRLESVQGEKLLAERKRLERGRTTTYQVLLFEQDLLSSQLARIRDQASILNIIAQMKLFGETL